MALKHQDGHHESMIDVEDALSKILSVFSPLSTQESDILRTNGMVLAEDVISGINIPPLDNSAMDGYAVKYENIKNASFKNPKNLTTINFSA